MSTDNRHSHCGHFGSSDMGTFMGLMKGIWQPSGPSGQSGPPLWHVQRVAQRQIIDDTPPHAPTRTHTHTHSHNMQCQRNKSTTELCQTTRYPGRDTSSCTIVTTSIHFVRSFQLFTGYQREKSCACCSFRRTCRCKVNKVKVNKLQMPANKQITRAAAGRR